ncbi:hypothetical protein PO909_019275, partial [Leuciscus waleckii]
GRWCEEDSLQTAARSTPTETFFRLSLETCLTRIAHAEREKAFKFHVDKTTAVSNNAVAVKCSFTVSQVNSITIASALIDTSQQRPGDFKDKGLSLKSRKQQHTVHQGTCV